MAAILDGGYGCQVHVDCCYKFEHLLGNIFSLLNVSLTSKYICFQRRKLKKTKTKTNMPENQQIIVSIFQNKILYCCTLKELIVRKLWLVAYPPKQMSVSAQSANKWGGFIPMTRTTQKSREKIQSIFVHNHVSSTDIFNC